MLPLNMVECTFAYLYACYVAAQGQKQEFNEKALKSLLPERKAVRRQLIEEIPIP